MIMYARFAGLARTSLKKWNNSRYMQNKKLLRMAWIANSQQFFFIANHILIARR